MARESNRSAPQGAQVTGIVSRRAFVSAGLSAFVLLSTPLRAAPPRQIRLGLIGCDSEGIGLATDALSASPQVELVAVADTVIERAQRAIDILTHPWRKNGAHPQVRVPNDRLFSGADSTEAILAIDDVDAVLIAGIPAHRPLDLSRAVALGKHAFLAAGPCAVDAAGCASLLQSASIAEAQGLIIGVARPWRHNEADLAALDRLASGDIGRVVSAEAVSQRAPWRRVHAGASRAANWYFDEALSGGSLLTESLPSIDRMTWLMGALPVSASGLEVRNGRNPGDIASHYAIQYQYGDGAVLSVRSTLEPGAAMTKVTNIVGRSGTIELDPAGGQLSGPRRAALAAFVASMEAPAAPQLWRDDLEALVASTRMAILGRDAARVGRTLSWSDVA